MTTYPDDADGSVLAHMAAEGIDMTQPMTIEFVVAVPDEAAANSVANAIAEAGYETEIDFDEGEPDFDPEEDDEEEFGPSWTVFAVVTMVPEYDEIMRIQKELNELAGPFGGASDGWGAMIGGEEE